MVQADRDQIKNERFQLELDQAEREKIKGLIGQFDCTDVTDPHGSGHYHTSGLEGRKEQELGWDGRTQND